MIENKIASSRTLKELEGALNQFFYSTTYRIEGDTAETAKIYNANGLVAHIGIVKTKSKRFMAHFISEAT